MNRDERREKKKQNKQQTNLFVSLTKIYLSKNIISNETDESFEHD